MKIFVIVVSSLLVAFYLYYHFIPVIRTKILLWKLEFSLRRIKKKIKDDRELTNKLNKVIKGAKELNKQEKL